MRATDKQLAYIKLLLEQDIFNPWVQTADDHSEFNFFHSIGKDRVFSQLDYLERCQASQIIKELKINNYSTLKRLLK